MAEEKSDEKVARLEASPKKLLRHQLFKTVCQKRLQTQQQNCLK
jgi:hypothetical protein